MNHTTMVAEDVFEDERSFQEKLEALRTYKHAIVPTPIYDELRSALPASWDRGHMMLCGSAALAGRGVRDVHDLDVLVTPTLWLEVKRIHEAHEWPAHIVDPSALADQHYEGETNKLMVRTGRVDFFLCTGVEGYNDIGVPGLFAKGTLIDGYRVISLRHCLAIKAMAGREKDLEDMKILATLIEHEERTGQGPKEMGYLAGEAEAAGFPPKPEKPKPPILPSWPALG